MASAPPRTRRPEDEKRDAAGRKRYPARQPWEGSRNAHFRGKRAAPQRNGPIWIGDPPMQTATTAQKTPSSAPQRDLIVGEPGSAVASAPDHRFDDKKVIRRYGVVVGFQPA